MKPTFWIQSITVAGHPTKADSTVTFTEGLNIICGPSNTGKSWVLQCIDYLTGADAKKFVLDEASGYNEVRIRIHADDGQLIMRRPIGQGHSSVKVESSIERIPSGTYKLSGKNSGQLNHVWLKLAGYAAPETLKVVASGDFKIQALTWRTFWHAFYADEDRVSFKAPVLLPTQASAGPPFKCALASLITGKDYAAYARDEATDTKKLKNSAVIEYLAPLPRQLEERIERIQQAIGTTDPHQIDTAIANLTLEVNQVRQQITDVTSRGATVVKKLQSVREGIAESAALQQRYVELASSYQSRLARLEFVHEGHDLIAALDAPTACPVCEQELSKQARVRTPTPDPREREILLARLADLQHTISQMDHDLAPAKEREQALAQEALQIQRLIHDTLEPRLGELSSALANHNALVAMQTELQQCQVQKREIEDELRERETKVFVSGNFNALDEFPDSFWREMSTNILDILGACAYPELKEAQFSRQSFDAVVNGKQKAKQGQGYRSLINTAVMLALRAFLASDAAVHNPGLLLIDTPLLGLDDPALDLELEQLRETIPLALYEYLTQEQDHGQIIVADNTKFMPDLERLRGHCNLIEFSKDQPGDRYGFLLDTRDDTLIDQEYDQ